MGRDAIADFGAKSTHPIAICSKALMNRTVFALIRCRIGDLRLQALCAYETFGGHDLAKRCLHLFAAMPYDEQGWLSACVYEFKEPHSGGNMIGKQTTLNPVKTQG